MNILSKNPKETFNLGKNIGKSLKPGMTIALEGDLGGGKTLFTKGLAKGIGAIEEITSPSFTLEKVYQIANNQEQIANLYHFDFYRIDNPKDMVSYELAEALSDPSGVVVVEWAEKIETELPKEKLVVKFHYKDIEERLLEFNAVGFDYKQLL